MPESSFTLVSVVCLSYQRRDYVLELLAALRRQSYPNVEIIVVDNNSQDGTAGAVEAAYPEVRLIRCPQNFGMVAYNIGLANARGKYIFVIDDDGLPASDAWLVKSVAHFEANPRLAALACAIRMADTGRIAYDSPQFAPDEVVLGGHTAAAYNGTGAGLRARALRDVGYYPFHFFRSWLELSLCTRLIDAGWEVRCFPDLEIWHRRPTGSVNRPITYYGLRNYFWYTWTFYPSGDAVRETLRFGAYCLKSLLKRRLPVILLARALRDAYMGWPPIAATRRPVSHATVAHLHRLRHCRNDYDLIPAQRTFAAAEESMPAHVA